jgi:hypothetical protein
MHLHLCFYLCAFNMKGFFTSIALLTTVLIFAQEPIPKKTRYIGFNANPMLAQVLPFNSINRNSFNASIINRFYGRKNTGIRFGFGVGIDQNNDVNNMFFSIDQDRRRAIHPNWLFFYGFGGGIKFINSDLFENANTTSSSVQNEFTLSMGFHWGIEYKINPIFSVSTEATLIWGIKSGNEDIQPIVRIDPPINIIAHFNLFTKK